jgi:C4-dicarboxylate transporter DctQ subunit
VAHRILAFLSRLDSAGRTAENMALVILLFGMILLAVGQILLREVFSTGYVWADELLKLMVLWLAMVGSIAACRDNRHIRIDVLSHLLPDSIVKVTQMLVDIFAAAVCGVLAWQAYRYLQVEIEFEDTVLIDTPSWLAHMIMPIAFAVISYRFAVNVLQKLHALLFGIEAEETP